MAAFTCWPHMEDLMLKRFLDFIFAVTLLIILWLPLLVLIGLVRWRVGSPVFFRQRRPGLGGKPFEIVKFRTMANLRNERGALLSDEARLTSFGRFLRFTSLDELPEIWNIIKGDMSFVGPRPLLMEYLPLYSARQARRHEVRPGLTGWAQVNGRNAISWDQKFEYDVWYVDNRCFWLDMKILWMTAIRVLRRDGISQQGHATMERFTGSGHG